MRQNELAAPRGAKRSGRRIGRGHGSGRGTTAGKGTKGQKARSGYSVRAGFEGGQLPLTKRLPEKRGFTNIFRKEYATVKVGSLNRFEGEVTPEMLVEERLIKSLKKPIKILGDGDVDRPLVVKAHKFTQSAKRKIEEAGGRAEEGSG
ncbi:MAG: 50S ribosomal protein L15 [Chloroflexota bacterium]|nr:50S ribosomal protein L15 [Chloroflexota bacterium]